MLLTYAVGQPLATWGLGPAAGQSVGSGSGHPPACPALAATALSTAYLHTALLPVTIGHYWSAQLHHIPYFIFNIHIYNHIQSSTYWCILAAGMGRNGQRERERETPLYHLFLIPLSSLSFPLHFSPLLSLPLLSLFASKTPNYGIRSEWQENLNIRIKRK